MKNFLMSAAALGTLALGLAPTTAMAASDGTASTPGGEAVGTVEVNFEVLPATGLVQIIGLEDYIFNDVAQGGSTHVAGVQQQTRFCIVRSDLGNVSINFSQEGETGFALKHATGTEIPFDIYIQYDISTLLSTGAADSILVPPRNGGASGCDTTNPYRVGFYGYTPNRAVAVPVNAPAGEYRATITVTVSAA